MKIIRIVLILFLITAAGAMVIYSQGQPEELSGFYAVPETIQQGVLTTFTFVFKVPMDTSGNLNVDFNMHDENNLILPTYWDGPYKCKFSYSFPNANENGTVEITLKGAKTSGGKDLGDIRFSVKVIHSAN